MITSVWSLATRPRPAPAAPPIIALPNPLANAFGAALDVRPTWSTLACNRKRASAVFDQAIAALRQRRADRRRDVQIRAVRTVAHLDQHGPLRRRDRLEEERVRHLGLNIECAPADRCSGRGAADQQERESEGERSEGKNRHHVAPVRAMNDVGRCPSVGQEGAGAPRCSGSWRRRFRRLRRYITSPSAAPPPPRPSRPGG